MAVVETDGPDKIIETDWETATALYTFVCLVLEADSDVEQNLINYKNEFEKTAQASTVH